MKKLLLLSFALLSITGFAQSHNTTMKLLSPAEGSWIQNGNDFDFTVRIYNVGTVAVTPTDTIWNDLFTQGGYVSINDETVSIAVGDSIDITHVIAGPQITTWGKLTICGQSLVYTGETDSTGNVDCNEVNLNPTLSDGEVEEATFADNSFYNNGFYNVDVVNAFNHNDAELTIYNLSGQVIYTQTLDIVNGKIEEKVNIEGITSGIYLTTISSTSGVISTQKVMVQ